MPSVAPEAMTTEFFCGTEVRNAKAGQEPCPHTLLLRRGPARREEEPPAGGEGRGDEKPSARVVYWEDAPKVLQFNRFIRSGYRTHYSYQQCLASVCSLHNETGNIWSHLLPALAMALIGLSGLEAPWPQARLAYFISTVSVVGCFMLSSCYHCFMGCHRDYHKWLTLDVCGIYMVLLGSEWAAIEWGFPCHPGIRAWGNGIYYSLGLAGLLLSCTANNAMHRGLPMLLMTAVRVGLLILRGTLSSGSAVALRYYWAMEALALFGGIVNVKRWPERWLQPAGSRSAGRLDLWGNSHQIMHVCVAVGMLLVHWGMGEDASEAYRRGAVCTAE